MFILLVCLVLMVQNYPADLVMLGGTIIFFITGVLPGEKGESSLARGCGAGSEMGGGGAGVAVWQRRGKNVGLDMSLLRALCMALAP